jgi:hypothetical protein
MAQLGRLRLLGAGSDAAKREMQLEEKATCMSLGKEVSREAQSKNGLLISSKNLVLPSRRSGVGRHGWKIGNRMLLPKTMPPIARENEKRILLLGKTG